jgi:hypothetical protein
MKKHGTRKIVLARETLRGLDSATIGGVFGGRTGPETCNQSCLTDASCVTCNGRSVCVCTAQSNCC